MNRLKIAQVGVANFGAYRRARLRETELFDLVAAYDWNRDALESVCADEGAHMCASFEEMLDFPGLEAVVISTGAKFHAEQAIAAMKRGLHVFIEKPLCSTPAEMQLLLKTQRLTGVVVGMGHHDHRTDAVSRTIQRLLEGGELGKIATFEKTTAHNGGLHLKPGDWRDDPDKNPGGMLFQCGVHALHELMFLFGPIAEVSALMRGDVHSSRTADIALCHLRFASGMIGTLNAYHVTPYRHTLNIFGTKANLYRDERFFEEGTRLWLQCTRLDNGAEPHEAVPLEGQTDACGNLRSFYQAIRVGGDLYPSLMDGARAVAAVFAAEESALTGQMVAVPEIAALK